MPAFETPRPIDLAVNLPVGAVVVVASDRTDTVVTVSPTNPEKALDRRGAEETKVDFDGTRLTVRGPKPRFSFIGPSESIDVKVELPTGSRLAAEVAFGAVRTAGTLGATRIKAPGGSVQVDAVAGDLWIRAGHGHALIGRVDGSLEITADHGQIRVDAVGGDATLKASHGAIAVGESGGALDAKLSYGDLDITTALGSVTAKTAYGAISLHDVSAGSIHLESGYGEVTIGVRAGIPAWLDLSSKNGRVRNELDGDRAPEGSEQTVAVRARTQFGDITIQRAR
jgi:DUF4097 and DUF4098 domain-containing protein YvlB